MRLANAARVVSPRRADPSPDPTPSHGAPGLSGPAVGEHAVDLGLEDRGVAELPGASPGQERLVRRAAPEEQGQARGELATTVNVDHLAVALLAIAQARAMRRHLLEDTTLSGTDADYVVAMVQTLFDGVSP